MKDYSANNLLENYQLNKSKVRLLDYKGNQDEQIISEMIKLKEVIDKLDYCISCLPEEEKNTITNIYIKKISMRNIGKVSIMARTTVVRKRDRAINLLENLLNPTYF